MTGLFRIGHAYITLLYDVISRGGRSATPLPSSVLDVDMKEEVEDRLLKLSPRLLLEQA